MESFTVTPTELCPLHARAIHTAGVSGCVEALQICIEANDQHPCNAAQIFRTCFSSRSSFDQQGTRALDSVTCLRHTRLPASLTGYQSGSQGLASLGLNFGFLASGRTGHPRAAPPFPGAASFLHVNSAQSRRSSHATFTAVPRAKYSVLVSQDYCNKFPQTWWFKTADIRSLSSGGQRSEMVVSAGHPPLELAGRNCSLSLPIPWLSGFSLPLWSRGLLLFV